MPLSHFVPAYPSPSPCPQVHSLRPTAILLNQQLSSFLLTDTPYSESEFGPRQKKKHILAKINSHKHNTDCLRITQMIFKQLQSDLQVRFKVGSVPSINQLHKFSKTTIKEIKGQELN